MPASVRQEAEGSVTIVVGILVLLGLALLALGYQVGTHLEREAWVKMLDMAGVQWRPAFQRLMKKRK